MSYEPDEKHIEDLVSKKILDFQQKNKNVSTILIERVTRLENRLGRRVSDNEVIDLIANHQT